ncbi:MAG: FAD-dependent oxidoreductase, partial [Candidatus Hydrogenedentes bacterium]|nr:FAD-dependent oxidoreductase [Candidatus Hydrogenedentota bacterium]
MAREAKYSISIADDAHWRHQIKCQDACPVHTDARGYVRAIAEGDLEKAYLIARGPNPLASICGRVCGAPCELNCRRGSLDAPVSIRALKRYAHETYQDMDLSRELDVIERIRESFAKRDCAGSEEVAALAGLFDGGKVKRASGQPVAIIGSGPAGLAAAHDLVLFGFSPVIYEMESVAAGMLYLGIPEYRLPHAIIEAEVDAIRAMGVEIKTDITIGKDISLSELMEQFASVIVAVGAKKSRPLPVPGAEGRGGYGGGDFLRAVALRRPMTRGQEVVVIGGGNVAYDVSRTALRREVESDVSRTALRLEGVKTVHLCCLEPKEAMLADEVEVSEGAEEGVILHNSYGPDEILLDESGAVRGIRMKKVLSIFDEQGRFAPSYDENDTLEIAADTVLVAIGQQSDFSFVDSERDGIEMTERGTFALDEAHSTSRAGLFVAGDAEHGPKLMIHAIASGKHAARSVYEYVLGKPLTWKESGGQFALSEYEREPDYEVLYRQQPAT